MNAISRTPLVEARRATWAVALLLIFTVGFFLARGMPWSHADEYAWIGTGIELAHSGRLTNPSMIGWLKGFGTDRFYVQLPFPAYSLAAWVLLFGSAPAGFIVFTWIWYAVGGYGLVRLFGRFELPLAMRLLLVLIYLNSMVNKGFRPEPEAFGLMFLGVSLVDTAAPFWRKTVALVLIGLGVLCYPIVIAIGAAFSVALVWWQCSPDAVPSFRWRETINAWLLPVLVSFTVVFVSFLAMIHFELRPFWTAFNAHRLSRGLTEGAAGGYWLLITQYREAVLTLPPTLLLVVAVGYVALRWRQVERRVRIVVVACAVAAVSTIFLYEVRAPEWVILMAFCAICAIASEAKFQPYRSKILFGLTLLFLWSNCLGIISMSRRQFPDPALLRRDREAALQSGKELVIDSSTARYVFHYQLPKGTLHAEYIESIDHSGPFTAAGKRATDYWIVTAATMEMHSYPMPESYHRFPHVSIFHHELKSAPLCPDVPLVFP